MSDTLRYYVPRQVIFAKAYLHASGVEPATCDARPRQQPDCVTCRDATLYLPLIHSVNVYRLLWRTCVPAELNLPRVMPGHVNSAPASKPSALHSMTSLLLLLSSSWSPAAPPGLGAACRCTVQDCGRCISFHTQCAYADACHAISVPMSAKGNPQQLFAAGPQGPAMHQ